MSHNLLVRNGQASMFYINEVLWHGLGIRLDKPATAKEAIEAANLNWPVIKLPLFAGLKHIPVPDKYAIVRKTSNLVTQSDPVLGVVGKVYNRSLQVQSASQTSHPKDYDIYASASVLALSRRLGVMFMRRLRWRHYFGFVSLHFAGSSLQNNSI